MGALGRVCEALERVGVIAGYEWRRGIAKKSVLALVILAVAIQTLVIVSNYEFNRSSGIVPSGNAFMWISTVLEGGAQALFIPLIAIIVAGGSMSEEYEHGTADILLSKPISRIEYMFGKFMGGYSLLALVEALITVVSVGLSIGFFGAQSDLQFAPLMFLAIAYSSLIFFCLSFMFSEVFRGTTLAILLAFAMYIASLVMTPILSFLYGNVSRVVPTWAATGFPSFLLSRLITASNTVLPSADTEALYEAALIIAVYTVVFVAIAALRLLKSDVTKKTD
ncbi:MAG: ABC transporter permease subunit [Candidatus Bathyarchaeia archaeon]